MINKDDNTIGDYKIGKLIGEGAFSKVKLGTHISGYKVAIKIIDKKLMAESNAKSNAEKAKRAAKKAAKEGKAAPVSPSSASPNDSPETAATLNFIEKLENEVQLLMRLDHPNIIKTYQVIDSEDECYVVMQFASGGEMMEYMAVKSRLTEREARKFFAQLVSGLDQIHQANIVHRDLKLENLLLDDKYNILISDFGLGRTFDGDRMHLLDTFCGTPHYAAVELVSGIPYIGIKSDIWALGVILYFFVTGEAPFSGSTIAELYDNIKSVRYYMHDSFSPEYVDLLNKILQKDPHNRISLDGIRKHPWMHMDGQMDIPTLPPRVKGKVDGSKLGQIIKSINSAKTFVAYTFNEIPRTEKDTLAIKEAMKTRTRSNSAVVARRKSISFNHGATGGAFRPNLGVENSANAQLMGRDVSVGAASWLDGNSNSFAGKVSNNEHSTSLDPSTGTTSSNSNGTTPMILVGITGQMYDDDEQHSSPPKRNSVNGSKEGSSKLHQEAIKEESENPLRRPSSVLTRQASDVNSVVTNVAIRPIRRPSEAPTQRQKSDVSSLQPSGGGGSPSSNTRGRLNRANSEFQTRRRAATYSPSKVTTAIDANISPSTGPISPASVSPPLPVNTSKEAESEQKAINEELADKLPVLPRKGSFKRSVSFKKQEPADVNNQDVVAIKHEPIHIQKEIPTVVVAPPSVSPQQSVISRLDEHAFKAKPADLVRRLSMVSPPAANLYSTFQEDQLIANMTVDEIGMENIALWHELHRPPKIIRSVKFAFRRGTFSSVLDTSTMFQDLHKVILSLPETIDKKLTSRLTI